MAVAFLLSGYDMSTIVFEESGPRLAGNGITEQFLLKCLSSYSRQFPAISLPKEITPATV